MSRFLMKKKTNLGRYRNWCIETAAYGGSVNYRESDTFSLSNWTINGIINGTVAHDVTLLGRPFRSFYETNKRKKCDDFGCLLTEQVKSIETLDEDKKKKWWHTSPPLSESKESGDSIEQHAWINCLPPAAKDLDCVNKQHFLWFNLGKWWNFPSCIPFFLVISFFFSRSTLNVERWSSCN